MEEEEEDPEVEEILAAKASYYIGVEEGLQQHTIGASASLLPHPYKPSIFIKHFRKVRDFR